MWALIGLGNRIDDVQVIAVGSTIAQVKEKAFPGDYWWDTNTQEATKAPKLMWRQLNVEEEEALFSGRLYGRETRKLQIRKVAVSL